LPEGCKEETSYSGRHSLPLLFSDETIAKDGSV